MGLEVIRKKLEYEWKNIYRALKQQETFPKGQGLVTKETLESVIHDNNVKLTKHEFGLLVSLFKLDDNVVSYEKISTELGLHSKKLFMIQPSLFANNPGDRISVKQNDSRSVAHLSVLS